MKAIILAAGLGTRLRPLTDRIPKPLVPIVGVPNIHRLIHHLRDAGIRDIFINIHYLKEALLTSLGDGHSLGVRIHYSIESKLMGTGGGIRKMMSNMGSGCLVVLNADALFMPPIQDLMDTHRKSDAIASMIVRRDPEAARKGAVGVCPDGRVGRLVWGGDQNLTNIFMFTGMHILSPALTMHLPTSGCIVKDTYIPLIEQGSHRIQAIETSVPFWDLGTLRDFWEANMEILTGRARIPGLKLSGTVVIGNNVKIHRGSLLENTIIGDRVILQRPVHVRNCIVLSDSRIDQNIENAIVSGETAISVL